jgi:NAD(P)-dependent dehydrogenase (short-subunit alcohol dehydrogenase family)
MGPDGISQVGSTVPLNRPATVEEIARVVASPAASYMTGSTIHADGGRQAI